MLDDILKEKFKLTSNYFETLFKSGKEFPQSIVFEGLDIFGQYFFALELARILNCQKNGEKNCNCVNCNWIRQNKHPSIVTVSQLDFKPSNDNSKTVISVKQSREVAKALLQSSDFHRFFIFTGATTGNLDKHRKEILKPYENLGFNLPEENWVPDFLNRKIFDEEASNAILKSVEEPPKRVTFIFLTKHVDDLISTITSRSMIFKLPASKFEFDFKDVQKYFEKYPNFDLFDALELSEKLQDYIADNDFKPVEVLNMIEEYLGKLLFQNPKSKKIKNDILHVQNAKKQLHASMSLKTVFESLMINFAN